MSDRTPGQDAAESDPTLGQSVLLVINGGSSSLKFAIFTIRAPVKRLLTGRIERIGLGDARMTVEGDLGASDLVIEAPDHQAAAGVLIGWLGDRISLTRIVAIGHRVVHGGGRHYRPERVTPGLLASLREIEIFAPNHLPGEIALIETLGRLDPDRTQVACFDTGFHHDLPAVSRTLPIPWRLEKQGVRRYGFHGISYQYLLEELGRVAPAEASGRVILAHLGAGASMAAVKGGRPIDTTMAFTPAAGLMMGTRSGDIDPGLVDFLAQSEGMTIEGFHRMATAESGLVGVSETSSDLRDLLEREEADPRAALAIDLFCYRAKLALGGLAAALGGLDSLVFSAGIGEHSAPARARICQGLEFLGIEIDPERNARHAVTISTDGGAAAVHVIPTDEEAMIARATAQFLTTP